MRTLSKKQVRDIEMLIKDVHTAFMVEIGGEAAVEPEDMNRVRSRGLLKGSSDLLRRAYEFGVLSGSVLPGKGSAVTPGEFMAFLNSERSKLSKSQQASLDAATEHMNSYVKGLASTLEKKLHTALIDADKHLRRSRYLAAGEIVRHGHESGASVQTIAKRLRKATQDLRKNWDMVAATEVNNLIQEGKASAIMSNSSNHDPRVFKQPRSTACPYCKVLYLEDDKVTPRIFRMSELIANGTNIDRKPRSPTLLGKSATQWRAVLDSTHPWCQCELHEIPAGMAFVGGKLTTVGFQKAEEMTSPLDRFLLGHECRG